MQRPYVIDEMISAKAIAARVEALCREIHDEFNGTDKLIVVGLLRGSKSATELTREHKQKIKGFFDRN